MTHSLDLIYWIKLTGYIGVFVIVFLEGGLFIGVFLPGDSLLFTAGLLAFHGIFNIAVLIPGIVVTTFLSYLFGYWFGEKLGPWLLRRPDSRWFKKAYVERAKVFYTQHGGKAVLFGRFIPVVRTFVPIVAGLVKMPYARYVTFNALGAIFWGTGVTLLGYYFGDLIPHLHKYISEVLGLAALAAILLGFYLKTKHRHS